MNEKQLFGVFAPVLGEKKDFPIILLEKTIQVDNRDILRKYGEIHRRKMREPDMLKGSEVDANSASGQKVLNVTATTNFTEGDTVIIDPGGDREEEGVINTIQAGISITLLVNLTYTHTETQADDVVTTKSAIPDGFSILHYHTFTKRSTAMQYFLAFTKAHIYVWNPSTKVWDLKFTCSSACTEWDTVSYNDKVIATNNVDKVLVWTTSGNFVALDDTTNGIEYETGKYLTKAKYVTTFENFLILGYTTEDSVIYPQRERWNAVANEADWMSGDAGAKATEGSDRIVGFKIYDGQLVIFKEKTRIIQVLVPTSEVWNWTVLPGNIGCLSNHSIVEDADGRVYWLADDLTIREMGEGEISQDIDPVVKKIEPSSAYLVYGIFIEETGEVWWSIPYDNALPNKVITVKSLGNWGELNLAVSAFGSYKED